MTPPKPRSDSTIDTRLDSLQAEIFFERLENGLSLREGVAWLLAEHAITLSEMSLSRWAAKRRRAQCEEAHAAALEILRADRAQAEAFLGGNNTANPPDAAAEFAQASLLLANHALFTAQRDRAEARIAQATRTVTALQNARTQRQRAETSRLVADRMQSYREFAAMRAVIEFEDKTRLSNKPSSAREDMREALNLYLDAQEIAEAEAANSVTDEAPKDKDQTDKAPKDEPPAAPKQGSAPGANNLSLYHTKRQ